MKVGMGLVYISVCRK